MVTITRNVSRLDPARADDFGTTNVCNFVFFMKFVKLIDRQHFQFYSINKVLCVKCATPVKDIC